MAMIFIEGFESGGIQVGDSSGLQVIAGGTGVYNARLPTANINDFSNAYYRNTGFSLSTVYYGFLVLPAATSYDMSIFNARNGGIAGTSLCTITWSNADRLLRVRRGTNAGTLIDTSIITIPTSTWSHIQVKYIPHISEGTVQVKLDGTIITSIGGNTSPGATIVDTIYSFGSGTSAVSNWCYYDDFVLSDSDWPGMLKIAGLVPDAAGSTTQWTSSVSTPNWECVNELPASDTDYVSTSDVNYTDTYSLSNVSSPAPQAIKAVQVGVRMKKESEVAPSTASIVLRTNSTDYPSSSKSIPGVFGYITNIWETNPSSTGVAWDVTAVNSLQAGIKSLT